MQGAAGGKCNKWGISTESAIMSFREMTASESHGVGSRFPFSARRTLLMLWSQVVVAWNQIVTGN